MIFLSGFAIVVKNGERMHFGFAKVAPPSGEAILCEILQTAPEPFACVGVGDIEHTGISHPCSDIVGVSFGILSEHSGGVEGVVIVDSSFLIDIWLMDKDCIHAHCIERIEHGLMIGEKLLVPIKTPHIGFDSIPIEVEYKTIYGISILLERIHHAKSLILRFIAIFRGYIPQGPEGREILMPGEIGIVGGCAGHRPISIYEEI